MARALGEAARAKGFVAPSFRSPPRSPGRTRTIRRHANGSATVSLVVRERPWSAVVADMVDGFAAVNPEPDRQGELRDLLWAAAEWHESAGAGPGDDAGTVTPLRAVPDAA